MITKKQAVRLFKEAIPLSENPTANIHEKRLAWSVFADSLHRDKLITDYQVNSWTNPFKHPSA